jgi:hypothetical protein
MFARVLSTELVPSGIPRPLDQPRPARTTKETVILVLRVVAIQLGILVLGILFFSSLGLGTEVGGCGGG